MGTENKKDILWHLLECVSLTNFWAVSRAPSRILGCIYILTYCLAKVRSTACVFTRPGCLGLLGTSSDAELAKVSLFMWSMILISANKVKEMDVQIYRAESEVHWEVNQQFWSIAATRANKRHFALGGTVRSAVEANPRPQLD